MTALLWSLIWWLILDHIPPGEATLSPARSIRFINLVDAADIHFVSTNVLFINEIRSPPAHAISFGDKTSKATPTMAGMAHHYIKITGEISQSHISVARFVDSIDIRFNGGCIAHHGMGHHVVNFPGDINGHIVIQLLDFFNDSFLCMIIIFVSMGNLHH